MMTDGILSLASLRPLILASGSPRRFKLLTETGVKFSKCVLDIDETPKDNENPFKYAVRIAKMKALEVSALYANNEVILAGDTVVTIDGLILGKPESKNDAAQMLSRLSGREHTVCTALAFAESKKLVVSGFEKTLVRFNRIMNERIKEYIDSKEPLDKAGAYGIQGMGAFLVDSIEGSLDNVIGLPITLLDRLARETGNLLKYGTSYK